MVIAFPFKQEESPLFGTIRRPVAEVFIRKTVKSSWQPITMIIDTGADYTLLPKFFATILGVAMSTDCKQITTQGVGGTGKVYLLKKKVAARIGSYERFVPIGFIDNNYIPPLLGRHEFLETFRVVFEKFSVKFDNPR